MPWVQSVVFHLNVEHLPGLLPLVSLSLDRFGVDTDNPYHANIPLTMRNGHIVLVTSFVRP